MSGFFVVFGSSSLSLHGEIDEDDESNEDQERNENEIDECDESNDNQENKEEAIKVHGRKVDPICLRQLIRRWP